MKSYIIAYGFFSWLISDIPERICMVSWQISITVLWKVPYDMWQARGYNAYNTTSAAMRWEVSSSDVEHFIGAYSIWYSTDLRVI